MDNMFSIGERSGERVPRVVTQYPVEIWLWSSPEGCLQTQIRPPWCCRQMRDSLVKTTSFNSTAYILLSSHRWRRRRLWSCVKGRPSNGRLADRPFCCKRRQRVRADTE
ncbi:hypothetical protein TNCV_4006381 [Trichonephila clavipes]|nr:hypothetical protein TNCV_4006381 [Trichonephila clavipes]